MHAAEAMLRHNTESTGVLILMNGFPDSGISRDENSHYCVGKDVLLGYTDFQVERRVG
jgi:hypothetical protein